MTLKQIIKEYNEKKAKDIVIGKAKDKDGGNKKIKKLKKKKDCPSIQPPPSPPLSPSSLISKIISSKGGEYNTKIIANTTDDKTSKSSVNNNVSRNKKRKKHKRIPFTLVKPRPGCTTSDEDTDDSDSDDDDSKLENKKLNFAMMIERERDDAVKKLTEISKLNEILTKKNDELKSLVKVKDDEINSHKKKIARSLKKFKKINSIVSFNVSGMIYTTSKINIPYDSHLGKLLTTKTAHRINGVPFIDRCPDNFKLIMNQLKGQSHDEKMNTRSLLRDVHYYGLNALFYKIKDNINKKRNRDEYESNNNENKKNETKLSKNKKRRTAIDVFKKERFEELRKRSDYKSNTRSSYSDMITEEWKALSKDEQKKYEPI